jgi:hypothetical protein
MKNYYLHFTRLKPFILIILILTMASIYSQTYGQKYLQKISPKINLGYLYKITPMDIKSRTIYSGPGYIGRDETNLLMGSNLLYKLEWAVRKNLFINFSQSFRYSMVFLVENYPQIIIPFSYSPNQTVKRITTNLETNIKYIVHSRVLRYYISLGYSVNNLGTNYDYLQYMGNGKYREVHSNFIYHGVILGTGMVYEKFDLALKFQYFEDYKDKYIFYQTSILPSVMVSYQLFNK